MLLNKDAFAGVDGFGSGGDMEFDYYIGLETDGSARAFSDSLFFGEGSKK